MVVVIVGATVVIGLSVLLRSKKSMSNQKANSKERQRRNFKGAYLSSIAAELPDTYYDRSSWSKPDSLLRDPHSKIKKSPLDE